MAITEYKAVRAPLNQIDQLIAELIADGYQPYGRLVTQYPETDKVVQVVIKGTPDSGGGNDVPAVIVVNDLSDATQLGKDLLKAANQEAARTAIGAGTSNLAVGTGATQAAAGNHGHAISAITGLSDALAAKADASALSALVSRVTALETAGG